MGKVFFVNINFFSINIFKRQLITIKASFWGWFAGGFGLGAVGAESGTQRGLLIASIVFVSKFDNYTN